MKLRRGSRGLFHLQIHFLVLVIPFGPAIFPRPAAADPPRGAEVSFGREVMAVLSRSGCNQGVCHGNRNGKGGFKLSLRGEDPARDHAALTRDLLGRRVDPIEPARSLILQKPTAGVPHEGGRRFDPGSPEHSILERWIARGCPKEPLDSPRLLEIEVTPSEGILVEPVTDVGLRVAARFSDGSMRDVTGLSVFEAAGGAATVSPAGLVERQRFGDVTILVRYLDAHAPARFAFVPSTPGFEWKEPPRNNYIDELVFANLRRLRIEPAALADDSTFLRRAFIDALGILPTGDESRAFLADQDAGKRARLIERLLERPELADHWALKWSDLLQNEERTIDPKGVRAFHRWIRDGIASGKPLDRFARELVAARGSTYEHPEANYYRSKRDPLTRAEATAQVFLGVRLQCARCHNHPFDRWTQDDYYGWAANFARVRYRILENRRRDTNDGHEFLGEQIVWEARTGEVMNPRSGQAAAPRFLAPGSPRSAAAPEKGAGEGGRLDAVARWIGSKEDTFFARAQANRIWHHLMGRGIVDPIDDFRPTNPPSNPELLDTLAADFAAHGFDLKHLVRVIMTSRVYQLSSVPTPSGAEDETHFSHALVRRLSAEEILDAQSQAIGAPVKFSGYPLGIRAGQLPGVEALRRRDRAATDADLFLRVFGKPPRLIACECERSTDTTLSQAFQLLSGPSLQALLRAPGNRLGKLLEARTSSADVVRDLYWAALGRPPAPAEEAAIAGSLDASPDRRAALEDAAWGILNSKEFLLRN